MACARLEFRGKYLVDHRVGYHDVKMGGIEARESGLSPALQKCAILDGL
jgi:hypothetical protein